VFNTGQAFHSITMVVPHVHAPIVIVQCRVMQLCSTLWKVPQLGLLLPAAKAAARLAYHLPPPVGEGEQDNAGNQGHKTEKCILDVPAHNPTFQDVGALQDPQYAKCSK
jgi:hypothetical protein